MTVFCKRCDCALWGAFAYQEMYDKYHKLERYRYCPNCKTMFLLDPIAIELEKNHSSKPKANEDG